MAASITAAAQSDIGRVRKNNQDAFGVAADVGLYVVCDGMGGAAGGEIASHLAVEAFLNSFRGSAANAGEKSLQQTARALYQAAMAANAAVIARATAEPRLRGMGSTLVAAHVLDDHLYLVNVGDSRAYLVRDGGCAQLTVDHSYLDEQVRMGYMTAEAAKASPMQSVITRAVGIPEAFEPDLSQVDLEDGDVVLLASDGLTRHVVNDELASLASGDGLAGQSTLEERCAALVQLAIEHGGSDNITCVLLSVALEHAESH